MAGSGEAQQAGSARAKDLRGSPPEAPLCASSRPTDGPTLVTVAAAVASGLGVLGFVTFAGGVVLWSRFKEMGVPADHALSLVPKSELVATGAEFLVPAVLLSALIVAAVFLISGLIDRLTDGWPPTKWLVAPALLGLTELGFAIALLVTTVPFWAFVLLVGVAALGAFVVSVSAHLSFAIFALVSFLAVGTFAIARTYERTSHDLEVLPMAYSRSQPGEAPRVELGYFVAETSDRIVFASVPQDVQNELREFPRSETDDLEVGGLAHPAQAEKKAARFAYNLCERIAHLKPASTQSHPTPVCRGSYLQELAEKAGLPWPPPVKNLG